MKNELKAKMVVNKRIESVLQSDGYKLYPAPFFIKLDGVVNDHMALVAKDGKGYVADLFLTHYYRTDVKGFGDTAFDAVMDAIRQVHLNDDIDLDKCGFYSFNKEAV